jgi:hypothetical protein
MPYRPVACKNTYRLIVVRKNLSVEKGEVRLFNDYVYFYYLTNDWTSSPAEVVFEAKPQEAIVLRMRNSHVGQSRNWPTDSSTRSMLRLTRAKIMIDAPP